MKVYVIVKWPESQDIMEKEWFNECMLANDPNFATELGSSAYFVPLSRYDSLQQPLEKKEEKEEKVEEYIIDNFLSLHMIKSMNHFWIKDNPTICKYK